MDRFAFLMPSTGYSEIINQRGFIRKIGAYFNFMAIKRYEVFEPGSQNKMGIIFSVPILPTRLKKRALKRCQSLLRRYDSIEYLNVVCIEDSFPIFISPIEIKIIRHEGLLRWASGLYVISAILTMKSTSWLNKEIAVLGADESAGIMVTYFLADKVNFLTLYGRDKKILDRLAGDVLERFGLAVRICLYGNMPHCPYDIVISATREINALNIINADIVLCYPGQSVLFNRSAIIVEGGYINLGDFLVTDVVLSPLQALYLIEQVICLKNYYQLGHRLYNGFDVNALKTIEKYMEDKKIKVSGYICDGRSISYDKIRKKIFI